VIDRLYTASEIAEQLGCSLTYVRSTLRKLQIKPAGNRERSATYSPEQLARAK
jgi:DNA-binding CsgD family transcriptional regulator